MSGFLVSSARVCLFWSRTQDIVLAKALGALSPSTQSKTSIANKHGVDILLGGHDHFYYCCKGVDSWHGYDINQPCLGAEEDHGDVLIVKSGTDFRELSEIILSLSDTPEGSIRKKVISKITGKRVLQTPHSRDSWLYARFPQVDGTQLLRRRHHLLNSRRYWRRSYRQWTNLWKRWYASPRRHWIYVLIWLGYQR